jgi:hypothetical protein
MRTNVFFVFIFWSSNSKKQLLQRLADVVLSGQ